MGGPELPNTCILIWEGLIWEGQSFPILVYLYGRDLYGRARASQYLYTYMGGTYMGGPELPNTCILIWEALIW